MQSVKNSLIIDKTQYGVLSLIKNGVFGNFTKLMDFNEANSALSGFFNGEVMPFVYVFAPAGEENQKTIQNAKQSTKLQLILNDENVGFIEVQSVYEVSKNFASKNIFLANDFPQNAKNIGKFALSGEITIYDNTLKNSKENISKIIKNNNFSKISAVMLRADPLHRAHERLIRIMIDESDFVIIFLIRTRQSKKIEFDLRLKTIEYLKNNYLPAHKIAIVAFENTYFFADHINPPLECIAAHNFGANRLFLGQNHERIGAFFEGNEIRSVLDYYKANLPIEISIMPEFVYCNKCKCLVSTKSCPHGQHHHVKYHSKTLKYLLFKGILPPQILMRSDISAIILNEIFPNRFDDIEQIYNDIFTNNGILENHAEIDFYNELMNLYKTNSLG